MAYLNKFFFFPFQSFCLQPERNQITELRVLLREDSFVFTKLLPATACFLSSSFVQGVTDQQ
jgi:hypothetical protein